MNQFFEDQKRFYLRAMSVFLLVACLLEGFAIAGPNSPILGQGVLLSEARINELKRDLEVGKEPQWSSFMEILKSAEEGLAIEPKVPGTWHVPFYYLNKRGHKKAKNGLRDQATIAYAQALAFRMTGDRRFSRKAIELLNAWSTQLGCMSKIGDSKLSFSYHFPTFIFAADLLRNSPDWSVEDRERFEDFLRNRARKMHTMDRRNNWSNWGLVLYLSIGTYLRDKKMITEGAKKWKELISSQISPNGHLRHEVKRSRGLRGIWYSHFTILPQTIAAEILKTNGINLYSYVSPTGRSLQSAYEAMIPWVMNPETFPYWHGDPDRLVGVKAVSHWEILNELWPRSEVATLLAALRPLSAQHGAPFLTFTHGR